MRVLHWYPNFLGGGGVANAVLGLAQAQVDLGIGVAIASAEAEGPPLYQRMDTELEEIRLFRWKPRWRMRWGRLSLRGVPVEVVRAMQGFNPDIVHIHGEFNPDNFWVPRIFPGKPMVLSPHGAFHPVVLQKSHSLMKRLYIRLAGYRLYRRVRAFHALNPAEASHIAQKLPYARIYTVPQGASPFIQEVVQGKPGKLHKDEIRYLFIGRLDVYTKGLDILLEAFAEALRMWGNKRPGLHLTLVGPDQQGSRRRLESLAQQLGLGLNVTFTGALPGAKVGEILRESDVYVQLSRHENQSLSVADALIAGKPCILSREIGTVSWPEVRCLPHVKIVGPDQREATAAILEWAERIEQLKAQAETARPQVASFFSWKRVAEEHLKTYEQLVT